ncbi:hypothetical protein [Sulfobacillus thermosulfidooxidans]|uniref:hypothetical protein n=1 Tax=Sulfobacillus thermosulfidooxidans TaxID=28034 RepID=UPI0006B4811C|nr:hypothetical protein [Sulfobacillus thermosulfidooxidans]
MLNIWPALFDLTWILTAQWLVNHNVFAMTALVGLYLVMRVVPPGNRQRLAVIVFLGIAAAFGSVLGVILGLITVGLVSLQHHDPHNRRYAYILGLVAWTIFIVAEPHDQFFPYLLLVMAIGGLIIGDWRKDTETTTMAILGIALVGALIIAILLWLIPWDYVVSHVVGAIGGIIVALLLTIMPKLKLRHKANTSSTMQGLHNLHAHLKGHSAMGSDVLMALIGFGIIMIVLWVLRRRHYEMGTLSRRDEAITVKLENIHVPKKSLWQRESLTPVRLFVRRQLKKAQHHGRAKPQGMTFRQWIRKELNNREVADEIAQIYEGIRYGLEPDTKILSKRLQGLWNDHKSELPVRPKKEIDERNR